MQSLRTRTAFVVVTSLGLLPLTGQAQPDHMGPAQSAAFVAAASNPAPAANPVNQANQAAANVAGAANPSVAMPPPPPGVVDLSTLPPDPRAAFQGAREEILPLTPAQIRQLRKQLDESQRATASTPTPPPKPVSGSLNLSLAPGTTPPVVRLGGGMVTTLVFTDVTGMPWQIIGFQAGDDSQVSAVKPVPDGNQINLVPKSLYAQTNLSVSLAGAASPVTLTLVGGQKVVDYRLDVRVQARGPQAKPPVLAADLPQANPVLQQMLDAVPPSGAQALRVQGGVAQAWRYQDRYFLRTSLSLLSPAWVGSLASPDGTRVYEIPPTPIALVGDAGRIQSLTLQEASHGR